MLRKSALPCSKVSGLYGVRTARSRRGTTEISLSAPFPHDNGEGGVVPVPPRMRLAGGDAPLRPIDCGKAGVALGFEIDFRDEEAVGDGHCLAIDARAAGNHDLARALLPRDLVGQREG